MSVYYEHMGYTSVRYIYVLYLYGFRCNADLHTYKRLKNVIILLQKQF